MDFRQVRANLAGMMNRTSSFSLASFLLLSVFTCGAAGGEVRFTILHVNDSHGQTEPHRKGAQLLGGYARLATRADGIRQHSGAARVFLIHAGD